MGKYYNNRTISIKELMNLYLKKWYIIVIITILGGALFGAIQYCKDLERKKEVKLAETEEPQTLESFSDDEQRMLTEAIDYAEKIKDLETYFHESYIMNMDANNISSYCLYYIVELQYKEELSAEEYTIKTNNIIEAYKSYIATCLPQDILEAGDYKTQSRYINELITFNYNNQIDNSIFMINLCKVEELGEYKDIVIQRMDEYRIDINKSIADHDLRMINIFETNAVNSALLTQQQSYRNNYLTINNRLETLKSKFTEQQTLYYENTTGGVGIENEEVIVQVSFKMILVGCIFGCMLGGFLLLLLYIFSDYIHEMDYSNIFKICYLGNIIIDEKKDVANENGIAISDIDSAEKMALKLKRICEKDMITEFVVISSDKDALYESACDKLKQALSAYNIEIVELDELFANKTSMERLFEIGRCVLVEAKTASRVSKIKKMVEFLDSNEIDIIGVIDYE